MGSKEPSQPPEGPDKPNCPPPPPPLRSNDAAIHWRERAIKAEAALLEVRSELEKVVCTSGEDAGLILMPQDSPTSYDNPLGDQLIKIYNKTSQ